MKEVSIFAPTSENSGITATIINTYSRLETQKYKINIITFENNNKLKTIAKTYHGETYYLNSFFLRHPIVYTRQLKHIFSYLKSDTFIINLSYLATLLPIKLAKKQGIENIIVVSHSSNIEVTSKTKRQLLKFVHELNKWKLNKLYRDVKRVACSSCAGKWMFGESSTIILNNAVDINKFKFNQHQRDEFRKKTKVDGKMVLGNVGRLVYSKNQRFILHIACELKKIDDNFKLWFIGDGNLREDLNQLVKDLKLDENVTFWGNVENVSEILNAMDFFVFPSFFEGFPVSLVEAQVNGIPCIISDSIDKNVIVNNNVYQFPLTDDAKIWAEFIYNHKNDMRNSGSYERFKGSKWDIDIMLKKIESLL